jgi:hypothetical protein
MSSKKTDLDEATLHVLKKVLALPPRHHDEIKVGRPAKGTKPKAKGSKTKPAS